MILEQFIQHLDEKLTKEQKAVKPKIVYVLETFRRYHNLGENYKNILI